MANYNVTRRDGGWAAKRDNTSRAAAVHPTQAAAYDHARVLAVRSGGGEVRIHNREGKIRNSNTIGKSDPNPPRDAKH